MKKEKGAWWWRAVIYQKLSEYYRGNLDAGRQAIHHIAEFLPLSLAASSADRESMWDYNRLFVGPQRLLAPPIESCYRNEHKLVMQAETMAVRHAYASAGIELQTKNQEPDDHLCYELAFLSCLTETMAQEQPVEDSLLTALQTAYEDFLQEHLLAWIFDHLQDVSVCSESEFCRSVAAAAAAFFQSEKEALNHET